MPSSWVEFSYKNIKPMTERIRILSAVSFHYEISIYEMKKKDRHRKIVLPRQVAMYLLSHFSSMTLCDIGRFFDRDHTTVIHAKEVIMDLMLYDDKIKNDIEILTNKIKPNADYTKI